MFENYKNIANSYSTQLPHLKQTFEAVAAMPAGDRIGWAKRQRSSIFRDGWFVNTPVTSQGDAETVQQHVDHLVQLIDDYFPASQKELAKAFAECHDDQEVIAHAVVNGVKRDLNPRFNKNSYNITEHDKECIEVAAIDILLEADPRQREIWQSYKNAQDDVAARFNSLDKICVMWRCVDFVERGKYTYPDFQAYWDYWTPETAQKKLHPAVSKIYIEECWSKAEKFRPM